MTYLKRFLKRPLRQYWFLSLKCYSDWQLGAIQIELTTLTLRIMEDSAKQLVNSLQLTMICMIGLLVEGECILCFACTFRYVNTNDGILTWEKVTLIK